MVQESFGKGSFIHLILQVDPTTIHTGTKMEIGFCLFSFGFFSLTMVLRLNEIQNIFLTSSFFGNVRNGTDFNETDLKFNSLLLLLINLYSV